MFIKRLKDVIKIQVNPLESQRLEELITKENKVESNKIDERSKNPKTSIEHKETMKEDHEKKMKEVEEKKCYIPNFSLIFNLITTVGLTNYLFS